MKRLIWSAFIAFWACTLTLVAVGALVPERTAQAGAEAPRVVTMEELARHATADDCWMAIRGRVYDFSDYIPKHPTPARVMTRWCGREATEPYDTKGYGRPHSAAADEMMEEYFIGVLD